MKQESQPSTAASLNPVGAEAISHFTAAAVNARRALVAHAAAVLAMQRRGGSLRAIAKAFSTTLGREISKKQVETVLQSIRSGRITVNESEVAAMEARILGQLAELEPTPQSPEESAPRKSKSVAKPKAKPTTAKKTLPKTPPKAKLTTKSAGKAKTKTKTAPKPKAKPKGAEKKSVAADASRKRSAKRSVQQSTFFFGE